MYKHYTVNKRLINMIPTENREWTQVIRKGKHFLLHMWHPSCYSWYNTGDKSRMRKGLNCDYDKRNMSVVKKQQQKQETLETSNYAQGNNTLC
jgi:hypothetical protein